MSEINTIHSSQPITARDFYCIIVTWAQAVCAEQYITYTDGDYWPYTTILFVSVKDLARLKMGDAIDYTVFQKKVYPYDVHDNYVKWKPI